MQIVSLTKDLYEDWDKFCMESDDAWFWHTTDWLEFILQLRPEFNSQQKSFMVMNNNVPMAICPLILNTISQDNEKYNNEKYNNEKYNNEKYNNEKYNMFSFDRDGGNLPVLKNGLSSRQKDKILKIIFDHIDKNALDLDVEKCLLKICPLAPSYFKERQYNYPMKFGFLNTTLNTRILDLSNGLAQILNDMRKGHRYDVRLGERVFEVNVFDKSNIIKEVFDQYRILHHKAAGRVTRPLITFEMMYRWILESKAILCGAVYSGKYISFALVNIYKNGAYYSSASDDPDAEINVPASHLIQWNIINWLKNNRIRFYEIGLQQFGPQLFDFPSEKNISISFFKRGFGGFTVPVFSGEKFYSKELLLKTMSDRIKKLHNSFALNPICSTT